MGRDMSGGEEKGKRNYRRGREKDAEEGMKCFRGKKKNILRGVRKGKRTELEKGKEREGGEKRVNLI